MSSSEMVAIRPVGDDDYERITWALYAAIGWDPGRPLPPFEALLQHPEVVIYHEGWGRQGDLGVIAEVGGEFAGIAFCRLFSADCHGHGYVDAATPELGVAVIEGLRGRGIGTLLINGLADAARQFGFRALSLSVEADNPARRLYERLGCRELSIDGGGVRMLLELGVSTRP